MCGAVVVVRCCKRVCLAVIDVENFPCATVALARLVLLQLVSESAGVMAIVVGYMVMMMPLVMSAV